MKRILKKTFQPGLWLGFLALIICPAFSQPRTGDYHELLASFDPGQQEALLKGEILLLIDKGVNSGPTFVTAVLLFDCPRDRVWEMLRDPHFHSNYLDVLKDIKRLWETENQTGVEILLQWLFIKRRFRQINTYAHGDYYYEWRLDPEYDNDLSDYTGYWQLYRYKGNQTLGEYSTSMALDGLPGWLEDLVRKRIVKYSMQKMHKFIGSCEEPAE